MYSMTTKTHLYIRERYQQVTVHIYMCVCMCVCVRACVRVCVLKSVRVLLKYCTLCYQLEYALVLS